MSRDVFCPTPIAACQEGSAEISRDGRPRRDLRDVFNAPPRIGPRPLQDLDALPIQQSSLTHGPGPPARRLGISPIKSPDYIENVTRARTEPQSGSSRPTPPARLVQIRSYRTSEAKQKTVPRREYRQNGTVLV